MTNTSCGTGLSPAVALFHSLSDPTRLTIVRRFAEGEARVRDLVEETGLAQSTVSAHVACLRDCGIVVAVPEGRQTRYEIADPHLARSLSSLVEVTLAVNENAPCLEPDCSVPGCHATEVQA